MTPPDRRIWIDGALVAWDEARVHVLSHSLQRGSLVFDYMSVHETARGPAVFRLDEHLERFARSTGIVGLEVPHPREALRAAVLETVRANPGATAVKISAYLPSIEVDVVPADPRVAVAIAAYDPVADVLARKGPVAPRRETLRVRLERIRRKVEAAIPPEAKVAANYLGPLTAKWAARRAGFDEIVLVDAEGRLAEGPTTNLFLVDREGALRTPPLGAILGGITRRSVLELAKHEGIPAHEAPLTPEDLFAADEAFLTGTTAGVWPIESVDGRPLGTAAPGPVSRRLAERLADVEAGCDPAFAHWLTPVRPG